MALAGKLCQAERATSPRGGCRLATSVALFPGSILHPNLCRHRTYLYTSGCSNCALCVTVPFDGGISRSASTLPDESNCSTLTQYRSRGRCYCCTSSSSCHVSWSRLHAPQVLRTKNGPVWQSKLVKVNRTRANYKSEEYEISEARLEALTVPEGSSDVLLDEGSAQETSSWWEQFPKRWVIVLLCFTAFLLCNMDRVCNILVPLSKYI